MITGHGGNIYKLAKQNGCRPEDIIDMSSNLNPLGPPPGLLEFLQQNISVIRALPDAGADCLIEKFAAIHEIDKGQVLAGHGTTEFIYSMTTSLQIKNALILGPTYSDYQDSCLRNETRYAFLMAEESTGFSHDPDRIAEQVKNKDMVFICNPNNPTGTSIPTRSIHRICAANPDTIFVIDESYYPFIDDEKISGMLRTNLKNVIVLTSMSKIFSIPGLRTGFLKASPEIASRCRQYQVPWNVNSLAQTAVDYILSHFREMNAFVQKTRDFIQTEQDHFIGRFQHVSALSFFPSRVPYILIRLNNGLKADAVCETLAKDNILIRNCANFDGLTDQYIRVALKSRPANRMLADKLIQLVNRI
ncbi:MAG: aminotransferase class I/II-fold pyridoxal phosphate-dependent enzyme [Desulfobacteraceae bacterium]|nr:MAG: aminotransferase class I/II-fold pyridoxal phosphate-dependent enzyme [Desulfobacteraceae bacterium]